MLRLDRHSSARWFTILTRANDPRLIDSCCRNISGFSRPIHLHARVDGLAVSLYIP